MAFKTAKPSTHRYLVAMEGRSFNITSPNFNNKVVETTWQKMATIGIPKHRLTFLHNHAHVMLSVAALGMYTYTLQIHFNAQSTKPNPSVLTTVEAQEEKYAEPLADLILASWSIKGGPGPDRQMSTLIASKVSLQRSRRRTRHHKSTNTPALASAEIGNSQADSSKNNCAYVGQIEHTCNIVCNPPNNLKSTYCCLKKLLLQQLNMPLFET